MDNKIIRREESSYKGIFGCFRAYRIFVWAGDRLYRIAEKCAWYSKDRERKKELDKEWETKVAVADMVLENKSFAKEMLEAEGIEVSCKETVEELGATYLELKEQLGFAHETIFRLWVAHCDNDRGKAAEIFKNIGLIEEDYSEHIR